MESMYLFLTSTLAPYYGWFFAGAGIYELGMSRMASEASLLRIMLGIALAVSGTYILTNS
jgi:hypothetical protein